MSIWASKGTPDIVGLDNTTWAANYRGQGQPDVIVDVATATSWHNAIRVALFNDRFSAEVLLDVDTTQKLIDRLISPRQEALERGPKPDPKSELRDRIAAALAAGERADKVLEVLGLGGINALDQPEPEAPDAR